MKTISISIGNGNYRISSDDVYLKQMRSGAKNALNSMVRRAVGMNRFEPRMAQLFGTLIPTGAHVLDIGANIGCTTILFAQMAQTVDAFEPTPQTFEFWRKNISTCGHTNIRGHHCALGDENKQSQVSYSDHNRSGAFVMDMVDPGEGSKADIEVKRLDDIFPTLELPRVDFIKLDVEGYEGKVIEGGWSTIEKYRPVIQLELNSWCLNAQHRISLPDFLDFLIERFPIIYGIEKTSYTDVRNHAGRWLVMRENILEQRFKEMVVAFDSTQLESFHKKYSAITA